MHAEPKSLLLNVISMLIKCLFLNGTLMIWDFKINGVHFFDTQ